MLPIFNNPLNRDIIRYLRIEEEIDADHLPLEVSIRKKSAMLKHLADLNILNRKKKGRVWVYSIAWIYKKGFDWE